MLQNITELYGLKPAAKDGEHTTVHAAGRHGPDDFSTG
jgi:hypothetical protein